MIWSRQLYMLSFMVRLCTCFKRKNITHMKVLQIDVQGLKPCIVLITVVFCQNTVQITTCSLYSLRTVHVMVSFMDFGIQLHI